MVIVGWGTVLGNIEERLSVGEGERWKKGEFNPCMTFVDRLTKYIKLGGSV